MPKTRAKKEALVKSYIDKLNRQKSVAIATFKGLTVNEIEVLRKKCREAKIEYLIAKKTLLNLALKEKGLEFDAIDKSEENLGLGFGNEEIGPAKVFKEFSKEHNEKFNIIGGFIENKLIDKERVLALASLPGKEILLSRIIGSMQSPISGFVNVLQGNLRGLINALNGIKENKIK